MKWTIILPFLFSTAFAQEARLSTSTALEKKETSRNYEVNLFYEIPSSEFLISIDEGRETLSSPEKRIQFIPSATSNIGLQLNAFGIDAYYKTQVFKKDSSRVKKYGKSQFNDLRLKYDFGLIGVAAHYQKYKGFYADLNSLSGITISNGNTNSLVNEEATPGLKEDIIVREDIESLNWGGELFKSWEVLNPYSEQALIKTDEATPIGIDFHLNINYSRFNIGGSSSFIPKRRQENFGSKATLSNVDYHRLGTDLGLDFKWYFGPKAHYHMGFKIGPGLTRTSGLYESGTVTEVNDSTHFGFNTGLAYGGETHQFKLRFDLESWDTKLDIIQLDVISYWLTLQYGFRF